MPTVHNPEVDRGGFYIWPEGMADPTGFSLTAAAELPVEPAETSETVEPVAAPA
jgi:hypothetical protein